MIKRLVILFVTLGVSLLSFAQEFDFFALSGPVVSQIDGDHFGGYDKMGGVIGLGVSRPLNDDWNAIMELEYIQKGKGTYSESNGTTYKIRLNYIQIPIAINYQLVKDFSVETGFSIAFLLSSKFFENGEINAHPVYTPYFYDIDWILGSTYSLSEEWKVNLRFAYSVTPMGNKFENPENIYSTNFWRKPGGQYNNSLALAIQYWF